MALDGILLYKLLEEINLSLPCRIQKIYEISPYEILFQIHGKQGKQQLLISTHSQYNRILLTERSYPTPQQPGNFVMLLRKYLEGQTLLEIQQAGYDRWATFQIQRRNEIGDQETVRFVVELMGKYANAILVNKEGIIMDALKRIPPFQNTKRIIQPGAIFEPTPFQNKKNPFQDDSIDETKTLTAQFSGFSPFLQREVEYRMRQGQSFSSLMQEIKESKQLYIAKENGQPVFHCIALTSLSSYESYPLFEGLDILYYHKEEKERIKGITGDIYHAVKTKLKHETTKLPRLLKEMDEALDCDKYKLYGDLLYSYGIYDTKGRNSICLKDFESEKEITIPLDSKLDGNRNAQRCYTLYQKRKKGQVYLKEQISLCEKEIHYLQGILEQLDLADFTTAQQIKQELIQGGYLKDKPRKGNKKKKEKESVSVSCITLENGARILWGRNNLQNEEVTWKRMHKNNLWFHTKDYHGAHVILQSENPSEEEIRLAAMIASYYSKGRESSSVPVNWCLGKELKKIPGAKPGTVQLGSYKTIYIDPDVSVLKQYGVPTD